MCPLPTRSKRTDTPLPYSTPFRSRYPLLRGFNRLKLSSYKGAAAEQGAGQGGSYLGGDGDFRLCLGDSAPPRKQDQHNNPPGHGRDRQKHPQRNPRRRLDHTSSRHRDERQQQSQTGGEQQDEGQRLPPEPCAQDRKSTSLNSSH